MSNNVNELVKGMIVKEKKLDIREEQEKVESIDIHKDGKEYIDSLTEEEKDIIRSKCHTLHFVKLLKMQSKRADRMIGGGETVVSYSPVGVVLRTDEEIEVPDIPGEYTKETGIPPEEIKSRRIGAGEEFFLTYYEFMFLMFRPEYAGFCSRDEDPFGVYFSPKMPKFLKNDGVKLPTPTINFTKPGSPKEIMDEIDEIDTETGRWVIKEEYREKFASYLPEVTPKRRSGGNNEFPTSTNAALGLAQLLKKRYKYDI